MRKISLLFAIIVLLAGVSVQAQKRSAPQPIGPPIQKQLSVQDQDGDGYIWFDLATGEFKCNMCEYKYAFSGKGDVKVDGFNVYLSAVTDSYEMYATVDVWGRQGKALMVIYKSPNDGSDIEPFKEFWTDVNIDNNTLNCFAIQPHK